MRVVEQLEKSGGALLEATGTRVFKATMNRATANALVAEVDPDGRYGFNVALKLNLEVGQFTIVGDPRYPDGVVTVEVASNGDDDPS